MQGLSSELLMDERRLVDSLEEDQLANFITCNGKDFK